MATRSGGVRGLSFLVYVYEDHSILAVTRVDFKPLTGRDLRFGHIRLAVGREGLTGLSQRAALRYVANSILNALAQPGDRDLPAKRVGVPLGTTGVAGQLRLDLPE